VSVSAGHISIPAHAPITVRGVIDAQGRTTLGEPKLMPAFLGVWSNGEPLAMVVGTRLLSLVAQPLAFSRIVPQMAVVSVADRAHRRQDAGY